MRSNTLALGPSPHLSFQACVGHLRVQGWDQEEVQLLFRREDEAVNAQEVEGGLTITGEMPEAVNVPPGASVLLQGCAGDIHAAHFAALHMEQHQGDLSVQGVNKVELVTVHGDARVGDAQTLEVTTLHGDLQAKAVAEGLSIAVVHGDIALKEVKGQLTLENVTGDIAIRDPEGHLDVRNVTGDVSLSGNLQTGDYHVEALGDAALYLGTTSDVHLDLVARLGHISCGVALTETDESAHRLAGKMGQGTAQVQIVTQSGDIRLRPLGGDHVRHEMERERIWAEAHARREEAHARRADEHARREMERASREVERAQRIAERAQQAAERIAQKVEERATRAKRWQVKLNVPPPAMSAEALENERLTILQMLAAGKISTEQAENLLEALEG